MLFKYSTLNKINCNVEALFTFINLNKIYKSIEINCNFFVIFRFFVWKEAQIYKENTTKYLNKKKERLNILGQQNS